MRGLPAIAAKPMPTAPATIPPRSDLGSTNGTSLNDSDELLVTGHEIELAAGDRIHVGAWTTITVAKTEKSPQ